MFALGIPAAEGHMFNLLLELFKTALLVYSQLPFMYGNLQSSGGESAEKGNLLGLLADIDKPAAAGHLGTEFAHIDITLLVGLS